MKYLLIFSVCISLQLNAQNNNLKFLFKDSLYYQDFLAGLVSIPAVQSGLASKQVFSQNRDLHYPIKVAIDPGHLAGSWEEAILEERFIHHAGKEGLPPIKFHESLLTQLTAYLLEDELKLHGFQVVLTHQYGKSSFGMSYSEWYKKNRNRDLEDDLKKGNISEEQYNRYKLLSKKDLFHQYFLTKDLENRARIVNQFNPDIFISIHFNSSEFEADVHKNAPIVSENFSVFFVPGAFTNNELASIKQAVDIRRLSANDNVFLSTLLSASIANQFYAYFNTTPLQEDRSDIYWLRNFASYANYPGVFCRNLLLTRTIDAPLCYSEPLIQNNVDMVELLNKKDLLVRGIKGPAVLQTVSKLYFNGIMEYLREGGFSITFGR